jgi:hypothetical protein
MTERDNCHSVNNNTSAAHWETEAAHHAALTLLISSGVKAAVVCYIKGAYRTMGVLPSQQCLQAFYINGVCYASTVLTFGNRAAGFIWSALAALIQWIIEDCMSRFLGPQKAFVTHVGDDFLAGVIDIADLAAAEAIMHWILVELGDRAGRDKNQTGFRVVFTGIQANFLEGSLAIKEERRVSLIARFLEVANDPAVRLTRKELQSLAGKVAYLSTHSSGARVFVRSFYALAYSSGAARGRAVSVSDEVRQDLRALVWCISRVRTMTIRPRDVTMLETDASGIYGAGAALTSSRLAGAVQFLHFRFHSAFLLREQPHLALTPTGQISSSGFLELATIVVAAFVFREYLRGTTVVVCSDSEVSVACIHSMYSPLPHSAQLLKCLVALTVSHDISFAPVHRPRAALAHVDALSRGNVALFRRMVPRAALVPVEVPQAILHLLLNSEALPQTAHILGSVL